jgi:hypothetical protein
MSVPVRLANGRIDRGRATARDSISSSPCR